MIEVSLAVSAIAFVLLGIPYLFLLKRAGLSPYWSLIVLFAPYGLPIGAWVALPVLALRAWPARGEVANRYFLTIPQNITLIGLHLMMPIFSLYIIFKKANYSGWWCLTAAVPPLAIVMLWVCAFRKNHHRDGGHLSTPLAVECGSSAKPIP